MKRTYCNLMATTAVLIANSALAQEEPVDLGTLILSGGLTPVEADAYGRSVSVLTSDDFETRGIATIEDALRTLPGVSVTSTGSSLTQVRIRGSETNHVLVLVDGIEINSPSNGDYVFSGLPLEDVESIEVLRGPQSAIYGSNASGGVISITTKKGTSGTTAQVSSEVGNFDSQAISASIQHRTERGGVSFSYSRHITDGEDLSRSGGDTEFNNRTVLNFGVDYALTETARVGLTYRRFEQDYGFDDTNDPDFGGTGTGRDDYIIDGNSTSQREETIVGLWSELSFFDSRLDTRLEATTGTFDQTFLSSFGPYTTETERDGFKLRGSYALIGGSAAAADHKLNFVLERETETFTNSFAGGVFEERSTNSVAAEYQGSFASGFDLQVGLRHDDHSRFDSTTSWNISGAYTLPGSDIRLRGSAGTAVILPTMFEQFGQTPGGFIGNPNLQPEETRSLEVGADFGFANGRGDLGVTLFHQDIDNLIQGNGSTAVNLAGTSSANGLELSAHYAATDWLDIGFGYAYINGESATGTKLVRRPEHEVNLNLTAHYLNNRGTASVDLRHVDGNFITDQIANKVVEGDSFTTVNLALTYDINDRVELYGRVNNLFDRDYQEVFGYNAPSRTAFVGVRAEW
ncbi:TonB-dependent siderophore receptor [Thalassococcus sp. S3]|uniref:TonB-dependent receptor plug domain-containing protein n=1 Tax=Thalassococcus sp. S3 TaxID=2017482 RepID=UPI0010245F02|nr:TonB-dependent receptor [Thalassococcus sp. S3]QBF30198.1 TonB-dependent receptor [Thalassococcus sp. S3]